MELYRCKHFIIQELVGPKAFAAKGERCWEFLDAGMLKALDLIREKFGTVTINNWHKGGQYHESGLRDFDTSTGAGYSLHKFGHAFDLKFSAPGVTNKIVYDYILAHPEEFPQITAMEFIGSTPTWLHVDGRNHNQPGIWIVHP